MNTVGQSKELIEGEGAGGGGGGAVKYDPSRVHIAWVTHGFKGSLNGQLTVQVCAPLSVSVSLLSVKFGFLLPLFVSVLLTLLSLNSFFLFLRDLMNFFLSHHLPLSAPAIVMQKPIRSWRWAFSLLALPLSLRLPFPLSDSDGTNTKTHSSPRGG